MARVFLNNNAINQKGTPLLYTDILSNRPQYGINGRLFFSTDSQQIFEDTGTSWLLLADATGSVSGYVPYVGATNNVNLGPKTLQSGQFSSIDGNANTFQAIIQNNNLGFNSSTNLALGNDLSTNIGGLSVFSSIFTTGSTGPSALYKADGTYIYSNLEGGLTINSEYPTASLFFATNNIVALTINSSQGATFVNSVTATSFKSSTFTTGSVLFVGTTNNINQDNTNFFWDDTNNRLGIQTNSPGAPLDIHNTVANTTTIQINNTASSNAYISFQKNSTGYWRIGNTAAANTFDLLNNTTSTTALSFNNTTNAATFNNSITASSLIKSGGTSSQFLKADGSVDTTSYQPTITLTTTGTSGAATFSANTLNIPNYAPDLSGYVTLATTQTITGLKTFNPSVTASGAIARGGYYTPALTAAANSDVLVGLDINPTFTNGAFTGVANYDLRIGAVKSSVARFMNFTSPTTSGVGTISTAANSLVLDAGYGGVYLSFAGTNAVNLSSATVFKPTNDNNVSLGGGTASFRWANVYSVNVSADNYTFQGNTVLSQSAVPTGFTLDLTNKNIKFYNNSVQTATLFSTGNLAIGSTTDNGTDKLQVTGSAIFSTKISTTAGTNTFNTTSGNTLIGSTTDNGKKLQVNGTTTTAGFAAAGATYTVSAIVSETYYHVFQGGTGQTLTLLSPSSNNLQYVIINNSANTLTVAANGANNIYTPSGTIVSSITLIAYQRVFIIADGGTKYYQIF